MTYQFNENDKAKLIDIISKTVYQGVNICTIEKHYSKRSNQQNRYLWGCVYAVIAGEIGEDTLTVHQICAQKFLSEVVEVGNEEYRVVHTTKKLTTVEFAAYTEAIRLWAWHDLQISIPEPENATEQIMEQIREKYNQGQWVRNYEQDNS